jgi:hypothetical protein
LEENQVDPNNTDVNMFLNTVYPSNGGDAPNAKQQKKKTKKTSASTRDKKVSGPTHAPNGSGASVNAPAMVAKAVDDQAKQNLLMNADINAFLGVLHNTHNSNGDAGGEDGGGGAKATTGGTKNKRRHGRRT